MPHFDQVEAGATLLMSNYPGQPAATLPLSGTPGCCEQGSNGQRYPSLYPSRHPPPREAAPAPDDSSLGGRYAPVIYSLKTSHFQARTALPGNIQPRLAIDN